MSAQTIEAASGMRARRPLWVRSWALARRRPVDALAATALLCVVLLAIVPNIVAPAHYTTQDFTITLAAPSGSHLFGTDALGRDIFSRIVYGARTSMIASTVAVLISAGLGIVVGLSSGYVGGKLDLTVQRITDGLMSVPLLLMALIVIVMLGTGLLNVALALGLVGAMRVNRVIRGSTIAVKGTTYIEAALTVGCTSSRIVIRHVLPNVMAPLIVISSVQFGTFITAEAALSFLGLGVPPPNPSWGGMLSAEGRTYFLEAPWLAIFPGVAISITVLAANLIGDALRDLLDPRMRGSM